MKKRVLVSARVVADVERGISSWRRLTPEQEATEMASLCSEFNDFVRDHRSMDWVTLEVEKEYQDQCEHCGYEWETDDEDAPLCCEKALTEHEASKNVVTAECNAKPK